MTTIATDIIQIANFARRPRGADLFANFINFKIQRLAHRQNNTVSALDDFNAYNGQLGDFLDGAKQARFGDARMIRSLIEKIELTGGLTALEKLKDDVARYNATLNRSELEDGPGIMFSAAHRRLAEDFVAAINGATCRKVYAVEDSEKNIQIHFVQR